jgi:hypothetical protein
MHSEEKRYFGMAFGGSHQTQACWIEQEVLPGVGMHDISAPVAAGPIQGIQSSRAIVTDCEGDAEMAAAPRRI